ncbi:DUF1674 domain-containing protein [Paremcibacter congregatus]|uniref:DUF1674 domain-containing protein n=1 Tax=Paremcibacter congregatus TaxID=2043170 RepID=UPI003A92543E|tara:strand:+ start:1588 stop:1770 length:183 start_codon:yes stop_codon:yes gene_type:complete
MSVPKNNDPKASPASAEKDDVRSGKDGDTPLARPTEYGGREGPEPTRYGDWENSGIISDF